MYSSIFLTIAISILVKNVLENVLKQSDIDTIVNEHNRYRIAIANGQYDQPAGANLKRMKWHRALATAAQDWANQCKLQHNSFTLTNLGWNCYYCYTTLIISPQEVLLVTCLANHSFSVGFVAVGQNLAWTGSTVNQLGADFARVTKMWFDEVSNFIFPNGQKNSALPTGHYTQVVWANTEFIGCGYFYLKGSTFYEKFYVCNYGPAGNYVNEAPYLLYNQTTINCPNLC